MYFTCEFCGFWKMLNLQIKLHVVWPVEVEEGMNGTYKSRHSFIHIVACRTFFIVIE